MVEDYEQKLREESQQHEEDQQMLQDELHEKEREMQEIINQLDHENSMKS